MRHTGVRAVWPVRWGCRRRRSHASGGHLACSRTGKRHSSSRRIRILWTKFETLWVCTSIRRHGHWCYVSMRKARFRHWIEPSRSCPWGQAYRRAERMTMNATGQPRYLPHWILLRVKSSENSIGATAAAIAELFADHRGQR